MRPAAHVDSTASRPRRRLIVWPLRTEADYTEMRAVVDRLILDAPEHGPIDDRLEVMLELMEAYENKHHRLDTSGVTALDTLRFLLEQHGLSPSDLGRLLGDRSVGHKILSGERELSKRQIQKLCVYFNVSANLFI